MRKSERGEGRKGKGQEFSQRTKDRLWIERRQTQHIGNWQFIKVKGEHPIKMKYIILVGHVN